MSGQLSLMAKQLHVVNFDQKPAGTRYQVEFDEVGQSCTSPRGFGSKGLAEYQY